MLNLLKNSKPGIMAPLRTDNSKQNNGLLKTERANSLDFLRKRIPLKHEEIWMWSTFSEFIK